MTTYAITHVTTYAYSADVASSYGRGYLIPRDTPSQRVRTRAIDISPKPADVATGADAYGNTDLYFHVTTAHRELVVTARSTVRVSAPGFVAADIAWEDARPASCGTDGALAAEFVLDLVPAEITPEVRDYAAATFTPGRSLREAVEELTHRIYTDFAYRSGSTTVSTRVGEVLATRSGVCQDFARVAIACLRSQGLAARYVSGYLATQPPPGMARLVGADATHAWAAVWVPEGDCWLAFDPTNDTFADEQYVTLAWGRDYADVPPLRGVIYTDATSSSISVAVDVEPIRG